MGLAMVHCIQELNAEGLTSSQLYLCSCVVNCATVRESDEHLSRLRPKRLRGKGPISANVAPEERRMTSARMPRTGAGRSELLQPKRLQPSADTNEQLHSTRPFIPTDLVQNTAEYLGRVAGFLSFRGVSTEWQGAVSDAVGFLNGRCWDRLECHEHEGFSPVDSDKLWTRLRLDDAAVVDRCAVLFPRPRLAALSCDWSSDLSECKQLKAISNLAPATSLRELNLARSGVADLDERTRRATRSRCTTCAMPRAAPDTLQPIWFQNFADGQPDTNTDMCLENTVATMGQWSDVACNLPRYRPVICEITQWTLWWPTGMCLVNSDLDQNFFVNNVQLNTGPTGTRRSTA
jgi:hypothetical protein